MAHRAFSLSGCPTLRLDLVLRPQKRTCLVTAPDRQSFEQIRAWTVLIGERGFEYTVMTTYAQIDPQSQRQEDERQIRYLTIANYIYAGINALGVLFGAGIFLFVTGVLSFNRADIDPEALPILSLVGGTLGFLIVLIPMAATVLHLMFARCLQTRRAYMFCVVMAAWTCLSVPIGTAIGVLTLVVLMRPSVRQLFEEMRQDRQNSEMPPIGSQPHHGAV